jgi:hypothetical protein
MSTANYLITISVFFGTILVIFAMKYFSAAFAARSRMRADEAYRVLAEKAAAAEAENGAALAAIRSDLASVSASLAAIEKVLKQVG